MTITVPGRTELAGNHTDHQGGHVLAAAIHLRIRGEVRPWGEEALQLCSSGFAPFRISLSRLSPAESRPGTAAALARGVLDYLAQRGFPSRGFSAELHSEIPVGAGLSSSAAYSVWVGRCVSRLFYDDAIPAQTLALAAQYAENVHFGKPCGLMDPCACAFGGVTAMHFADPDRPVLRRLSGSPGDLGYALYVVQTGGGHQDLTADYAAVPAEMGRVAACFGAARLSQVSEAELRSALPGLRDRLGDRALLRALHFFDEERRVERMAQALAAGDMQTYLREMDASGRSSAELLQNSYSPASPGRQGISLALGLCRRLLDGRGAARVHGGGFAGTVQVLLPEELAPRLEAELSPVFGPGSCIRLHIVDA